MLKKAIKAFDLGRNEVQKNNEENKTFEDEKSLLVEGLSQTKPEIIVSCSSLKYKEDRFHYSIEEDTNFSIYLNSLKDSRDEGRSIIREFENDQSLIDVTGNEDEKPKMLEKANEAFDLGRKEVQKYNEEKEMKSISPIDVSKSIRYGDNETKYRSENKKESKIQLEELTKQKVLQSSRGIQANEAYFHKNKSQMQMNNALIREEARDTKALYPPNQKDEIKFSVENSIKKMSSPKENVSNEELCRNYFQHSRYY